MSKKQTKATSSATNEEKKRGYFSSIGVIKIDWSLAGYPDVRKVADQWAEDSNFRSIVVRRVSKDNFGIQFIYLNLDDSPSEAKKEWRKHFKYAEEKFGKIYAIDYDESSSNDLENLKNELVVYNPIRIE